MNDTLKRHLISAGQTFVATFLLTLSMSINTLDMEALEGSILVALLVSAARAGVKAVVETAVKVSGDRR